MEIEFPGDHAPLGRYLRVQLTSLSCIPAAPHGGDGSDNEGDVYVVTYRTSVLTVHSSSPTTLILTLSGGCRSERPTPRPPPFKRSLA
jgi:hypothetical protein